MEDGECCIGVFVDADLSAHVVTAVVLSWNLQDTTAIAHGIVVGDRARFLDAENIGERGPADEGHEGAAGLGSTDAEATIVCRQITRP